jgi:hypothetical protein
LPVGLDVAVRSPDEHSDIQVFLALLNGCAAKTRITLSAIRLYYRKSIDLGVSPVATKSQRKTTRTHRRRAAARGLVRVEVQAPKKDAGLIRALAETLRGKTEAAEALRVALAKAVMTPELNTAFDIFGSELPDEAFTGVFDQPRQPLAKG